MAIKDQLSSSMGRNDERPNLELAREIASRQDSSSVRELIHLVTNGDRAIQNDGIKVLYEIGNIKPGLISEHLLFFMSLLKSNNNRLQWGALTAIDAITKDYPELVYPHLAVIMTSARQGSVITRDHAVNILIGLSALKARAPQCVDLLFELLEASADNQFPMYAERIQPVVAGNFTSKYIRILESRLPSMVRESGRKRVLKVIKSLVHP